MCRFDVRIRTHSLDFVALIGKRGKRKTDVAAERI
jgi:hypothetical protein